MVLRRRAAAGTWGELAPSLLNGAWSPPDRAPAPEMHAPRFVASRAEVLAQRSLPALGIAGAIAWLAFVPMQGDAPSMPLDRERAEAAADAALEARGVRLGPEWRRLSTVSLANERDVWPQHKFVWQEAGPAAYRALVGGTLAPPLWQVRYAMFEGDVAARAEEWRLSIEPDGRVRQLRHILPEARPGARLAEDAALAVAQAGLRERFAIDPAALKLVAAEETERPARTDWAFTFADPRVDVGKDGEARLGVAVAGDEVVGAGRFVHVPEQWMRAERERDGRMQIAKVAGALLVALAGIAAIVFGVQSWMRGHCDTRAVLLVLSINLCAAVAGIAVMWPVLAAKLKTTEPVAWQVLLMVSGSLLAAALGALVVALATGVGAWAARAARQTPLSGPLPPWAAGAAAALLVAGVSTLAGALVPPEVPRWPSLALASAASPVAAAALEGVGVLSSIGIALFVLTLLERLTAAWTRRTWLALALVVLLVGATAAVRSGTGTSAAAEGLVAGLIAAAIVYGVLRFDARTVPGYVVAMALLGAAEDAVLDATPAGWTAFAIGAAVSVAVGYAAHRYLGRPLPPTGHEPDSGAPPV